MNYKVVYFSRSGHSKNIAENIAKQLNCPLVQIQDGMNWSGIIGFIKAGRATVKNRPLNITLSEPIFDDDPLIVVSPVWAGGVAQPVRVFLEKRQTQPISLILTSGGPIKDTFNNNNRYKFVGNIYKNSNNQEMVIGDLMNSLEK